MDAYQAVQFRDFLKGKKTYITAAIGILGALAAWADVQIDGVGLAATARAALQTRFNPGRNQQANGGRWIVRHLTHQ